MVNNILDKISSDMGVANFEYFQQLLRGQYGLKWKPYHGTSLGGNDFRKLLIVPKDTPWHEQATSYSINVLVKLDSVLNLCFSSDQPDKIGAQVAVDEFQAAWAATGWSVTLKSHYITAHLMHKMEMLDEGESLGVWSETASKVRMLPFVIHMLDIKVKQII